MSRLISQDDFSYLRKKLLPGMIVNGSAVNTVSLTLESGTLGFGYPAVAGSTENSCIPYDAKAATNDFFRGIYVRKFKTTGLVPGDSKNPDASANETVELIDFGIVAVTMGASFDAGKEIAYHPTVKWVTGSTLGSFVLKGSVLLNSGVSGEIAKVKLVGVHKFVAYGTSSLEGEVTNNDNETDSTGSFLLSNTVGVNKNA